MSELHMLKSRAVATPGALIYVRDKDSQAILRKCLSDLGVALPSIATGDIATATAELAQRPSPRLLVVDVSGVDNPVARVHDLAAVCDPSTGVIVVGDANDVALYRSLKAEGIAEYFYKPLIGSLVGSVCNAILTGDAPVQAAAAGKLVLVIGVHAGTGATGIATWLAWHLAEARHRRVMLVDLDLHAGDAALQLDVAPNQALCEALEQPERVDDLFVERGAIHVTPRFDLLASLEPFDREMPLRGDAVHKLLNNLTRRYHYVFVDVPPGAAPQLSEMIRLPSVCLLVSDASSRRRPRCRALARISRRGDPGSRGHAHRQ